MEEAFESYVEANLVFAQLQIDYLFLSTACAAARRAIGTRDGEQDT